MTAVHEHVQERAGEQQQEWQVAERMRSMLEKKEQRRDQHEANHR
jgi:hypothetical protein